MTDVKYNYDWVLDAKAQRDAAPIRDTPKGIAAKPDEEGSTEEQGFLERMYDRFVSGFADEEEAIDAMSSKKPSREAVQSSVLDEMEELARRSAEEAALLRMEQGITQSLSPYAPRRSLRPPSGTEETTDAPQVIEEATPVTVEELEPSTPTGGLMARPLTAGESTALSDMGSEITVSQGYSITDDEGDFSATQLNNAVSNTVRNPVKKALIDGMVEVEVGDRGPIVETGYSRRNVAGMSPTSAWGRRLVRDGIMTAEGEVTGLYSADNVFNSVYANRNGNGDFASGDGSRYKGRGLLQLTGRTTYQEVQDRLEAQGVDIDIMSNPELVNDERYALPAALAYLDYKGLDDATAEGMSTKSLNDLINSKAPRATAEDRWNAVVSSLRAAGDDETADEMALRNEYAAQETAGTTVDGAIGPNSRRAMRSWLDQNDVTIPEDATDMDLVVLVNRNS